MTLENSAYLFDSSLLCKEVNSRISSVLTFVANRPYVSAYAKEIMEKFDIITLLESDIDQWFEIKKNREALLSFVLQLNDDKESLGMADFIIESEYAKFLFLISLKCVMLDMSATNISRSLDNLYSDYVSTSQRPFEEGGISTLIITFNERIEKLVQNKKDHIYFKNLFREQGRSITEQLKIADNKHLTSVKDLNVANYYLYLSHLTNIYVQKKVKKIFASNGVANQFSEAIKMVYSKSKANVNLTSKLDDGYEYVERLARIILMLVDYLFTKIINMKSIKDLSENDKYLFAITWVLLQNEGSNMFFCGSAYSTIKDIFVSMKEELNI